MKKTVFAFMALMCMTLGLTACGDDEPEKTVSANATYQIDFSQDLIDVASVAIVYVADNGKPNIETLPEGSKQWLKQVTCVIKGKSIDLGYKVVYTFKNKELTKENYDLKATGKITASTPSSSRTFDDEKLMDESSVKKNRVEETVNRNSGKAFGVNVTREGSIEKNTKFTVSI